MEVGSHAPAVCEAAAERASSRTSEMKGLCTDTWAAVGLTGGASPASRWKRKGRPGCSTAVSSGPLKSSCSLFGNCGYDHSEVITKDCREKSNSTARDLLRESSYINGLE